MVELGQIAYIDFAEYACRVVCERVFDVAIAPNDLWYVGATIEDAQVGVGQLLACNFQRAACAHNHGEGLFVGKTTNGAATNSAIIKRQIVGFCQ